MNPDLVSGKALYSPLLVLSYFLTFGFFNPGYPHAVIGCMSYNSTRKMNTAIKIGVVLVAVWSLSLSLLAGTIRNAFPNLAVSDYALPTLAVAALPHWVAGLTLAGVVGALQSTVGTMVSAFYIPLMLGLYWMRANEWGALAGMVGGLATYLLNGMGVVNWKMGMEPMFGKKRCGWRERLPGAVLHFLCSKRRKTFSGSETAPRMETITSKTRQPIRSICCALTHRENAIMMWS